MTQYDFMIGDWIKAPDGKNRQVRTLSETKELHSWPDYGCCIFEMEPIILTDHVLTINSFRFCNKESGWLIESNFFLRESPDGKWIFGKYLYDTMTFEPLIDLKYIHELQHILRVFKSEKYIVL